MALPFIVAVIRNEEGEYLIGKHPNLKTKPYPGMWDLPGGKLEKHETPLEGVIRELKEETGFDAVETKLLDVFHHNENTMLESVNNVLPGLAIGYEITIKGDFLPDEFDEVRWVKKDQLTDFELVPWAKYFLFEEYKNA